MGSSVLKCVFDSFWVGVLKLAASGEATAEVGYFHVSVFKEWTKDGFHKTSSVFAVWVDRKTNDYLGKASCQAGLDSCFKRAGAELGVVAGVQEWHGTPENEIQSIVYAGALDCLYVRISFDYK